MPTPPPVFRQGDVCLLQVDSMPSDCVLVPDQQSKITLAWGEMTGHHHRIEDHAAARQGEARQAGDAVKTLIASTQAKARLWRARSGDRFLEVVEPVTLQHEEHTAHSLPPGIYKLPRQVEYTPTAFRPVAD
jgi:hypothetical protein